MTLPVVRWLNQLAMRCAWSWPGMLIALVGFAGSLYLLIQIAEGFVPATGGFETFDAQNNLTIAGVYTQLEAYTDQSRRLYFWFTFVDYFFPFFAGLFAAAVVAFFLGVSFPRAAVWVGNRHLWALFFVGPLFDWIENICAAFVVFGSAPQWSVEGMLLAKQLKLIFVVVSQAAMPLMACVAVGTVTFRWVKRKLRRN